MLQKNKFIYLSKRYIYAGRSLGNININGKRLVSDSGHLHKKVCLSGEVRIPHARVKTSNGDTVIEEKKVEKIDPKLCSKYPELFEPHTFAPKDLLALLKNLEHEISVCETSLKDENDKRNKYKVGFMHVTKHLFLITKVAADSHNMYFIPFLATIGHNLCL